MNVPAVASRTFSELRHLPEYNSIVELILKELAQTSHPLLRVKYIHNAIDQYNQEVFSHPYMSALSPCTIGCSACCHTQVSVTDDEAKLLFQRIQDGVTIDEELLKIQMTTQDDDNAFFRLKYADRKCIFLDNQGSCKVYEDRPSVCRTNAVLGKADQCDTSSTFKPIRLIRTQKADMVIYAFYSFSKMAGTLHRMVGELLKKTDISP